MKNIVLFVALLLLEVNNLNANPGCFCNPAYTPNVISTAVDCYTIKIRLDRCYDQIVNKTVEITYSTVSNSFPSGTLYTVSSSSQFSEFFLYGLLPNTKYYFRVKFVDCPSLIGYGNCTTLTGSQSCPNPVCLPATNINCSSFKANWINYPCHPQRFFNLKNLQTNQFIHFNRVIQNQTSIIVSNLPAGTYVYYTLAVITLTCNGVSNTKLVKSNEVVVQIINSPANAGPDIVANCINGNCVNLQASGTGIWTIDYPSSSGAGCYFDHNQAKNTSTNPNATFCMGSGLPYAILRWNTICGSDVMYVYNSITNACGTISNPTQVQDIRDLKYYPTILINNKCWFAKNLNYGNQINFYGNTHPSTAEPIWPATAVSTVSKYCFQNQSSNCDANGGLYFGDFAQNTNLCPPCWHVADYNDWNSLLNSAGSTNSIKANNITSNSLGFKGYVLNSLNGWLNAQFSGTAIFPGNTGYNGNSLNFGAYDNRPDGMATGFWIDSGPISSANPLPPNSPAPSWQTRYNGTRGGYGLSVFFFGSQTGGSFFQYKNLANRDFAFPVRCVRN